MIRRLPVSLPSLSSRPASTTTPQTPPSAAETVSSARRIASGESQFTSASSARRVALEVPQRQAGAPQGTPTFRLPAGISEDRPVSIPTEAGSNGARLKPLSERLEEASQDPAVRVRLALLRARFDRAFELPSASAQEAAPAPHHCCDQH